MPGIIALRQSCTRCSILFALAEERIFDEDENGKGGVYHPDCYKAEKRRSRIRELFVHHVPQPMVSPRHHINRSPDPPKAA